MTNFTLSILLIVLAGFFQGTFGLGMKKFTPVWESYWIIFSISGLILIPFIWARILVPDVFGAISVLSTGTILYSVLFGAMWGISAILFGLAINYVGVSLSFGICMSTGASLGSLLPLFQIENFSSKPSFPYIILGILVMTAGVVLISYAGSLRNKFQTSEDSNKSGIKKGLYFQLGIVFSVAAGVGAALQNISFTSAAPAIKAAIEQGVNPQSASLVAWIVVLFGGFIPNITYSVYLLIKNKSWESLFHNKPAGIYLLGTITGFCWFAALGVYGQSAAIMGEMGPVICWTMFFAISLIVSSFWGIRAGEWRGTIFPFNVLILGNIVLIISWVILGYANTLL
jgi:L-rhamnose-H+ transport protein